MSKNTKSWLLPIILAIIAALAAIIPSIFENIQNIRSAPTSTATLVPTSIFTPSSTHTPTLTPTSTFTPSPTATAVPIPCANGFFACVFPQADTGKTFLFKKGAGVTLTVDEQSQCALTTEVGAKLTYEITQARTNAAWGVQWIDTVGYFDASNFTSFAFAVKGELGGETFLIGMRDIAGGPVTLESKNYVTVSSTKWQLVTIPLSRFTYQGTTVNPSALENVSFSFDERHGSGTICLDDIAFIE